VFTNVADNLVIGLKQDLDKDNVSISVRNNSQVLHVGPNANQTFSFYILRIDSLTLGLKDLEGNYSFDVTVSGGAEKAISTIDSAIQDVSDEASRLGAYQNRLTYAAGYANTAELTATEALGTVENADYPEELINLTLNQIKQESSTAMLAQSNLQAQRVLELLFGGGISTSG
jgi:flagellin